MLNLNEIIGSIPADKKTGWTVLIDGQPQQVEKIEISSKFGTFTYGLLSAGYDAWLFYEPGGGGAVTVPYAFNEAGELFIGLLPENRKNMGGVFPCVIGGFLDPGETHSQAQSREADEEAGLVIKAKQLPGLPTNSNRAFFVTDVAAGEGVTAYGIKIPFEFLEPNGSGGWRLKKDENLPNYTKSASVEFLPWKEAILSTPDTLARSAIAQLLTIVF